MTLSWLTIISMIIGVAATTWYLTRKRSTGTIEKLHSINDSLEGKNNDLRKALSETEADNTELRQIAEVAMHEWKSYMRQVHDLRDTLCAQKLKTKSAEEAAEKLKEKNDSLKQENAKIRAINADMVQKLQAKDRENIRLTELIFKLNKRIKHYRLKMKKLYSEPVNVENTETVEIWTTYEEVIQLFEKNKAPNTAISEASTINRGMLRLQA